MKELADGHYEVAKKLKEVFEALVASNRDVEIELSCITAERQTYRMSRNTIIQPQVEVSTRVSIRVINEKRVGIAVTDSIDEADILQAFEKALSISKIMNPAEYSGLPEKPYHKHQFIEPEENLFKSSKNFERLNNWFLLAKEAQAAVSGKYQVSYETLIVFNSKGTEAVFGAPVVLINFIVEKGELSGFGSFISRSYDPFTVHGELERAISKCSHNGEKMEISPGRYDVILEPEAAAELFELFSVYSFGAKLYQEGRSYITGRLGERIGSESITLLDDANKADQIQMPFDYEGVPKKRVPLIEKGIIKEVVYDTETARRDGRSSTGHALPQPNPHGPAPVHLCLEPGNLSYENLIKKVDRGILITRLNYTNIEDLKNGIITGMTRDGTFIIEKGEILAPTTDLRFIQSVPEAIRNIDGISNIQKIVSPMFGYCLFPALLIRDFNITGAKGR